MKYIDSLIQTSGESRVATTNSYCRTIRLIRLIKTQGKTVSRSKGSRSQSFQSTNPLITRPLSRIPNSTWYSSPFRCRAYALHYMTRRRVSLKTKKKCTLWIFKRQLGQLVQRHQKINSMQVLIIIKIHGWHACIFKNRFCLIWHLAPLISMVIHYQILYLNLIYQC